MKRIIVIAPLLVTAFLSSCKVQVISIKGTQLKMGSQEVAGINRKYCVEKDSPVTEIASKDNISFNIDPSNIENVKVILKSGNNTHESSLGTFYDGLNILINKEEESVTITFAGPDPVVFQGPDGSIPELKSAGADASITITKEKKSLSTCQ